MHIEIRIDGIVYVISEEDILEVKDFLEQIATETYEE